MANNEGKGSAADAGTMSEEDQTKQDEAAAKKAQNELLVNEAKASVEGAKAKVERQQQHLEGAEEALKNAEAALATLKEGK